MFVVRLSGPSREDWKAFGKRDDAFQRFAQARRQIIDDELDDVRAVMFQVPGETDARRAVERIKSGDPDVIMVEKSWITLSADEEAEIMKLIHDMTNEKTP